MTNALASEKSPYLLQHADNPVAWLPWGEAAFEKARREGKPIFLSIGYSTCHWCHVMAHESFEDEAIAAMINRDFVPVKVDREERPDVDKVYMTYVQAKTGHGGWPLSVWLTPELKPFFGGTYFAPEDRGGRTGLPTVLKTIADGWANDPEALGLEAERALENLRSYYQERKEGAAGESELAEAAGDAFERAFLHLYESFDAARGGFGGAPKFPRSSNLDFLTRVAWLQRTESETGREAVRMIDTTLRQMTMGGIHDQVGGGFHRYSVDEAWFVPHFEKMLYDQAQVAVNLLDGFAVTGDERHAYTAGLTLDYARRELRHGEGGFWSAEDADSLVPGGGGEKAEGAFYVWTAEALREALREDREVALCVEHFGLGEDGNVPRELDPHGEMTGRNILRQRQPLAQTAARCGMTTEEAGRRLGAALEKLQVARLSRPRPHLDDKVITAWNGLMISALAKAAGCAAGCLAERRADYLAAATAAATFVERELYDEGKGVLYRAWREGRGVNEGFAEDYAYWIAGMLDLYEAGFDARWLRWAERLQGTMDRLFWDEEGGGYFNSGAGDASIVLRLKEDYDGAEPSPNSVAVSNLARLAGMLRDDGLRGRAARTAEALRAQWSRAPHALPAMLCGLEWLLAEPAQAVLAGRRGAADFEALAAALRKKSGGRRVVLAAPTEEGGEGEGWLRERAPWLSAMKPVEGRAALYLCEHHTCLAPVTEPAAV